MVQADPARGRAAAARCWRTATTPHALHTLKRILTILKTIVAQIDVLETMTPRQFLAFRDRLDAASGFQSAQFRELEAVLGRRDRACSSTTRRARAERARIEAALARPTLFDSFLRYLAGQGYAVPASVLERDVSRRSSRRRPCRTRCSPSTATTARPRRCASGWSTSTRACRSGATAT